MRIAILEGGRSLERAVSLRSGARVGDALTALGHEVTRLDLGRGLVPGLREISPDVVFVALHGTEGEDGTVQSLLELMEIPYTGPGSAACRICTDKGLAKLAFRDAGLPTPDWVVYNEEAIRDLGAADTFADAARRIGLPIAVKPASQGSSLGVKAVQAVEEIPGALVTALSYDRGAILEGWVHGRELAVGVLGGRSLPIVEAIPEGAAYDFEARYEIGAAHFECPASLPSEQGAEVERVALAAYRALGCAGFARVDLILAEDGPQLLEVNAVPGLTDTSLLPQAAEAAGIEFEALVEEMVSLALDR